MTDAPLYNFQVSLTFWSNIFWLILAIILCMPIAAKVDKLCAQSLKPMQFQCLIIAQNIFFFFLCVTLLVGQTYNPFIYFRF